MASQSGEQVSTRLSDLVIVPTVYQRNVVMRMLQNNAFLNSGVMVRDPELDAFLSSPMGGNTFTPRWVGPLALDEPNISNDNPADRSTPKKITSGKMSAVRQNLNQSWSSMDLNASLLGMDPMGAIESQTGDYWRGVSGLRLLGSVRGVIDSNIANNGSDMVIDISGESGADALFNADAFIDAQGTMGDRGNYLSAVAVHSVVYSTMKKNDLIEFEKDSEANAMIPYYMGLRVIQDDAMTYVPAGEGGGTAKYYSYLFGAGVVSFGIGNPKVPVAVHRDEAAGMGGGEEVLHTRQEWVIHPQGFSFALTETPTMAQLIDPANWTRVFERKRVPFAAIISQG